MEKRDIAHDNSLGVYALLEMASRHKAESPAPMMGVLRYPYARSTPPASLARWLQGVERFPLQGHLVVAIDNSDRVWQAEKLLAVLGSWADKAM